MDPTVRMRALDDLRLPDAAAAALRVLATGGCLDADDPELVLLSTRATLGRETIAAWPALRHVAVCGTSLARVDLAALAARGVTWSNVEHYGDHPVAEVVFSHLVRLARGLGGQQWRDQPRELAGKRLTIVGMGALGRAIADMALAYRMRVAYVSRTPKPDLVARDLRFGSRCELLPDTDVLVLTGPTDTVVLEASDFDLLPPEVVLVQSSVGRAFDEGAFLAWLGRPGNFAVFDLAVGEDAHAAWSHLPQVVFPHQSAGFCAETRDRLGEGVLANVRAFVEGRHPSP